MSINVKGNNHGGDMRKKNTPPPVHVVTIPVFNRLKDADVEDFLKDPIPTPPKLTSEKRDRAIKKFYSSLRFPDSVMDIPFNG